MTLLVRISLECEAIMYDLMALALETDSTRVISMLVPGQGQQPLRVKSSALVITDFHIMEMIGKIAEFNQVGKQQ